jgi:hypothetical protein
MADKLRQAASQALEVLERARGALAYVALGNAMENPNLARSTCSQAVFAIDNVAPKLQAALAEPLEPVGPFEYWNAVEGWVTVEPDEVVDGRAKQKMLRAALKTVDPQYKDDPEVMFALGWEAGFNARYRERP